MDVVPNGLATYNDETETATVSYLLDGGHFKVELTQYFDAIDGSMVNGISKIEICVADSVHPGELVDGLTGAHLRAIPVREAADLFRDLLLDRRAAEIIAAVPVVFDHERAYAKLAEVLVKLKGMHITNPTVAIARAKEGDSFDRAARDRWAMRVKRARSKGYLGQTPQGEWYLTATASGILG